MISLVLIMWTMRASFIIVGIVFRISLSLRYSLGHLRYTVQRFRPSCDSITRVLIVGRRLGWSRCSPLAFARVKSKPFIRPVNPYRHTVCTVKMVSMGFPGCLSPSICVIYSSVAVFLDGPVMKARTVRWCRFCVSCLSLTRVSERPACFYPNSNPETLLRLVISSCVFSRSLWCLVVFFFFLQRRIKVKEKEK